MKIAEFVRVLDRGGIESFILNNINAMDRTMFDIDFILTRRKKETYDDLVDDMGCNKKIVEINYNLNKVLLTFHLFFKFYQFFKKHHYDVIHFHSLPPGITWAAIIAAARATGHKNVILHAHTAVSICEIHGLRWLKWVIGRKMTSMLATQLLACSDAAAVYAFSPSEVAKKKYKIINNGIDVSRFSYNEQRRDKCRENLGISDKFVIGCVARITYLKNHSFMIDVLEELLKIRDDVILLIVGGIIEGEEKLVENIRIKLVNKGLESKCIMLEGTSKPEEIMNALDVYLMPSFREGFSFSGIEAQCSGLIVLASDRITSEMKLTDNYISLPLEAGAKKWAEVINCSIKQYERCDCSDIISNKGYDIKNTSAKLQSLYLSE